MKSATRRAGADLPFLFLLGLAFLVVAVWVAFGLAFGLAAVGVACILSDYFVVGADK